MTVSMIAIAALITAPISTPPPSSAEPINERADVEGNAYQVRVRKGEVRVHNRSGITAVRMGRSIERRRQMREAVRIVTGCHLVEDFWRDAHLVGELDCSAGAASDAH